MLIDYEHTYKLTTLFRHCITYSYCGISFVIFSIPIAGSFIKVYYSFENIMVLLNLFARNNLKVRVPLD